MREKGYIPSDVFHKENMNIKTNREAKYPTCSSYKISWTRLVGCKGYVLKKVDIAKLEKRFVRRVSRIDVYNSSRLDG